MKITTRYQSDYEYKATNENGNTVNIDMRGNDEKTHLSPMEMVLSALSACVAVEIALVLKKRRKTVTDLQIDGDGERNETEPKRFTSLHLKFILTSPDATLEELDKIAKLSLEKYCSVAASLNAPVGYSCEIKQS